MLTAEQAKARIGKIGSSNVPSLLGLSPYGNHSPAKQRRNAYFDIMGLSPRKESNSLRDGVFMEPAILNYAEWRIGKLLKPGQEPDRLCRDGQYTHDKYGWMIASLDGEGGDIEKNEAYIVEAKYVENPEFVEHWGRAGCTIQSHVPDYVVVQVMHQLLVCGPAYQTAYVASYRVGKGFGLYTLKRDNELIDLILQKEIEFFEKHLKPQIPPEADEQECAA